MYIRYGGKDMAKTKQELETLKQEYRSLTAKLQELSEDELMLVTGGFDFEVPGGENQYEIHVYGGKVADEEDFTAKFKGNGQG